MCNEKICFLKNLVENLVKIEEEASKIFVNPHENLNINEKGNARDLVTEYDKKTQAFIENSISSIYPDAKFLGEESEVGNENFEISDKTFIIDPIDGTTNYIFGLNHNCISIGYVEDGCVVAGVVFNPYTKEVFSAIKGQGAYKNGKRMHVNDKNLSRGLVGFGTAVYYDDMIEKTKKLISEILFKANDLRRLGSAAIDLCYVADGRFAGFFETRLCPWDYSVGILLIQEAGGRISDFDGNPVPLNKKSSILAGNPIVYEELKEIVKKYL